MAERAGADVELGCNTGNCGVCEVELTKFDDVRGDSSSIVVRSCITVLPRGYSRIEIDSMGDSIWGLDGFDT